MHFFLGPISLPFLADQLQSATEIMNDRNISSASLPIYQKYKSSTTITSAAHVAVANNTNPVTKRPATPAIIYKDDSVFQFSDSDPTFDEKQRYILQCVESGRRLKPNDPIGHRSLKELLRCKGES